MLAAFVDHFEVCGRERRGQLVFYRCLDIHGRGLYAPGCNSNSSAVAPGAGGAILPGGLAGPLFEGAMEGAGIGKAELSRDRVDGDVRAAQIFLGGIAAAAVLELLEGGALALQPAAQGWRGNIQGAANRLEARETLGKEKYTRSFEAGKAMSIEEAMAYALAGQDE